MIYLKKEEIWWSQRAKIQWLQHGDLNTKYFHQKANQRRRKNSIYTIHDSNGDIWKDSTHIHSTFLSYIKNMFSTKIQNINLNTMTVVKNRLSSNDFDILNTSFSTMEVIEAIKSLKSNSAPGPDGLTTHFYQHYWDTIENDILDFALNILNNDGNPNDINHTFISLIPKGNNPIFPSDFRPISLCNVLLKVITKTLANRVKRILPNIINDNQSVFFA